MTMREAHARRSRCVRGICGRSRRLVGLGRRLGVVLLLAALACVEGTQTADNGGQLRPAQHHDARTRGGHHKSRRYANAERQQENSPIAYPR